MFARCSAPTSTVRGASADCATVIGQAQLDQRLWCRAERSGGEQLLDPTWRPKSVPVRIRSTAGFVCRQSWAAFGTPRRYLRRMGANSPGRRVEPVRRLPELDHWTGMWVAIKDGVVIAAAPTSRELVMQVRSKGEPAKGAVAQFVPAMSDEIVIGVG